jgi:hypothetical protein
MDLKRHEITGKKMVGYLSGDYPEGEVPEGFLEKLKEVESKGEKVLSFGVHVCEYCQSAESSSELIVGDYIWPDMLAHYISVHRYKPPEEFVNFIMSF